MSQPGVTTGFCIYRIRSVAKGQEISSDSKVRFDLVADQAGYWHRTGPNGSPGDRVHCSLDEVLDELDQLLDLQDP